VRIRIVSKSLPERVETRRVTPRLVDLVEALNATVQLCDSAIGHGETPMDIDGFSYERAASRFGRDFEGSTEESRRLDLRAEDRKLGELSVCDDLRVTPSPY